MTTCLTFIAAVTAALNGAADLSARNEHGGAIYQQGTCYSYTAPQEGGGNSLNMVIRLPRGSKLAGLYHSHPSGPSSTEFSREDINTHKRLGVPSFIIVMEDRSIKALIPGQRTAKTGDTAMRLAAQ